MIMPMSLELEIDLIEDPFRENVTSVILGILLEERSSNVFDKLKRRLLV